MLRILTSRFLTTNRSLSQQLSSGEEKLAKLLRQKFPKASNIDVEDISGGCGSMYKVAVESVEFKGLTKVAQHKAITSCLSSEIKDMHGLTIDTKIPKQ
ncbi:unnamed protein product, partial [Mesorhabditis belari]|uniref:BolA-like protein 3 n=1 Tax=Mesorhabditis belari TaxID=2138241 RepID=A0AAF3F213_9BILA